MVLEATVIIGSLLQKIQWGSHNPYNSLYEFCGDNLPADSDTLRQMPQGNYLSKICHSLLESISFQISKIYLED